MYIAALLIDVLILISLMQVGQTIDKLEAKFMTEAASIRDEVNNLRIQVTGELMSIKDNIKLLIQLVIRSHKTQVSNINFYILHNNKFHSMFIEPYW